MIFSKLENVIASEGDVVKISVIGYYTTKKH